MKLLWTVVLLAIFTCAWGCGPTPYQKAGPTSARGYSEKRLSEDTFHVQFTASPTTPADVMQEYLYRRAAEITLRHHFRYFAVVREPGPLTAYQTKYRTRDGGQTGNNRWEVEVPVWGTLQMTIQCFKNPENASGTSLINAEAYLYGRPESKPSHG